jgi:hypothetical protein
MIQEARYVSTPGLSEWSSNPLVAALGKFLSDEELSNALYANPYRGLDLPQVPIHLLDPLIDKLTTDAFVVGPAELAFASAMQRMLFMGLTRRDPNRSRVIGEITQFSNQLGREIDQMPWSSKWADAGMVDEITGQGKSHIPQHILKLWPAEAIRHGAIKGVWDRWLQLVYLYLDMSYDGNLRGLLQHILNAIDSAFNGETDYAEKLPRKAKNIAQLQVYVIDALKRHFCGLLVLDELQAISLLLGKDAKFVANFFLRLLNQGIPIIFEGNPFAFKLFDKVSQLWDRFTSVPFPTLTPGGYDDDDMSNYFLPKLFEMQVMNNRAPLDERMKTAIFQCSAWHRRHVVRAVQNGQRYALARESDCMEPNDVIEGFRLMADKRTQARIDAFVTRDAKPLLEWRDIPVLDLLDQWEVKDEVLRHLAKATQDGILSGQADPKSQDNQESSKKPGKQKSVSDVVAAEKRKVNARLARQGKKAAKVEAQQIDGTTDPDDLRKKGIASALAKGFEDLPSATPSSRPTTTQGPASKPKTTR